MTNTTIDLHLFQQAAECLPHGLVISDMQQTGWPIIYANPAFLTLTGYTLDEILGRNCNFLQDSTANQHTIEQMKQAIAQQVPFSGVVLNTRKDGSHFWNQLTLTPILNPENKLTHMIGTQTDITELVTAQNKLHSLVDQDYVTGVANRKALTDHFDQHKASQPAQPLSLCWVSIDNFKAIHDKYGQLISDELLRAVSGRVAHVIKAGEMIARYNDNSFVCLIHEHNALPLEQRTTHLNDPYRVGERLLSNIQISIYCTHYPAAGEHLEQLITLAAQNKPAIK